MRGTCLKNDCTKVYTGTKAGIAFQLERVGLKCIVRNNNALTYTLLRNHNRGYYIMKIVIFI